MKRMLIVAALLISLAAAGWQIADARNRGMSGGQGMTAILLRAPLERLEFVGKEIGLDQKQMDQIRTIRSQHRHAVEPVMSQMRLLRQDLHEMLAAGEPGTQKEAQALSDQIMNLEQKIMKQRIDVHYQLGSILTAEQKDKLRSLQMSFRDDMRDDRRERRDKNSGRGMRDSRHFGHEWDDDSPSDD